MNPSKISLHIKKGIFLIIELVAIIIYIYMIQFSINILPINIILGIICVLFLPGYNLLNILKPRFNVIEKVGYMTMLSLAVDNIFMFFWYLIFYNIFTTPENPGFVFNGNLLILSIQIINIILISINLIYLYKELNRDRDSYVKHKINEKNNKESLLINFNYIREKINLKVLLIYIGFFLSLILLCISTLYSHVPNNEYSTNYNDYKSNFIFFYRVPFMFYIFLASSIISLTYIVIFTKNKYLILISISVFIYCIWILPYLQIGNYFSNDTYSLFLIYNNYLKYGIRSYANYGYIIKFKTFTSYRYSTTLFTSIILTSATGTHINFVLWYLYPIIFIFIPFFFYSIFQRFSKIKKNDNLILIILTLLAISTPQIVKVARSAVTGVIGAVLFFMLVLEFLNLFNQKEFNLKIRNIIMIILLYSFLCLTHFEECIYFLILIMLYGIYYLFFEIKKIEYRRSQSKSFIPNINNKHVKRDLNMIGFLLCLLSLIFYLSQEFFGFIPYFFEAALGKDYEKNIIYILYQNTKIEFYPILRGNFLISTFVICLIILGTLIYIIAAFFIFFKFYGFLFKIVRIMIIILKRIHVLIKKLISMKIFQFLIFPLFFGLILLINFLYFPFLEEEGLILIVILFLSYTIIIFHIFLFINGIKYYKVNNHKQNYFILSIISSSLVMFFLFAIGNRELAFYLLNSRFSAFFIFFNLIIVQNTYFKDFINKKRKYLILMLITLLSLGTFYSLRNLAWG